MLSINKEVYNGRSKSCSWGRHQCTTIIMLLMRTLVMATTSRGWRRCVGAGQAVLACHVAGDRGRMGDRTVERKWRHEATDAMRNAMQ